MREGANDAMRDLADVLGVPADGKWHRLSFYIKRDRDGRDYIQRAELVQSGKINNQRTEKGK